MTKLKLLGLLLALVLGLATAMVLGSGVVSAKIGTTITPCENGGGNTPGSADCPGGGGITQPDTVDTNPQGKPPPVHNP
jgi:hypothetical protein